MPFKSETWCDPLTCTSIVFFSLLVSFVGDSLWETEWKEHTCLKEMSMWKTERSYPPIGAPFGKYKGGENSITQSTERTCYQHWDGGERHSEAQGPDPRTLKGPIKTKKKEGDQWEVSPLPILASSLRTTKWLSSSLPRLFENGCLL